MDYRLENFKRKFTAASSHLGVAPDAIISLKFREIVNSYDEYHRLVRHLEDQGSIRHSPLNGDFQGKGHLISDSKNRVILVEHESGLEILAAAGDVASILMLIPLIVQAWRALRGRHPERRNRDDSIEIRQLDRNGALHEDRADHLGMIGDRSVHALAGNLLDREMRRLTDQLSALSARVEILEKQMAAKATKRRTSKRKPSSRSTSKRK